MAKFGDICRGLPGATYFSCRHFQYNQKVTSINKMPQRWSRIEGFVDIFIDSSNHILEGFLQISLLHYCFFIFPEFFSNDSIMYFPFFLFFFILFLYCFQNDSTMVTDPQGLGHGNRQHAREGRSLDPFEWQLSSTEDPVKPGNC